MGSEAAVRRSAIESWAMANGLGADFIEGDLVWGEDGTADVQGSLMLANTEATSLPEGLRISDGDEVYVRADQTELKTHLGQIGVAFKEVADPREEKELAA